MGNIETVLSSNIAAVFFAAFIVARTMWYGSATTLVEVFGNHSLVTSGIRDTYFWVRQTYPCNKYHMWRRRYVNCSISYNSFLYFRNTFKTAFVSFSEIIICFWTWVLFTFLYIIQHSDRITHGEYWNGSIQQYCCCVFCSFHYCRNHVYGSATTLVEVFVNHSLVTGGIRDTFG